MKSQGYVSFILVAASLIVISKCIVPSPALEHLKIVCKKLCVPERVCPPECAEFFLDPWADPVPSKRASGLDGFTFDDYLFLRWLGRDLNRRGIYRR